MFVPPVNVPLETLSFSGDNALMRHDDIVDEPVAETVAAASSASVASLTDITAGYQGALPQTAPVKRKWLLPAGIAALIVLIGASAIVLSSRNSAVQPTRVAQPAPKPVLVQQPVPVVVAEPAVPLPDSSIRVDSVRSAAIRRGDSLRSKVDDVPRTAPRERTAGDTTVSRRPARRDTSGASDPIPVFRDATKPVRDGGVRKDTSVRRVPPPR